MSVLWCGGEDVDFQNGISPLVSTNGSLFRSGYSRCAIAAQANPPNFVKGDAFPGGAITSAWVNARMAINNNIGIASPQSFGFGKIGSNSGLFIGVNTNGSVFLNKYDGTNATTLATSASGILPTSATVYRVDLQLSNFGVSGTLNLYINGSSVLTYTGDLTIAGITGFDSVFIGGNTNNTTILYYSEIIVSDSSTLGVQGLDMRELTGNGTTQQWSNPAYTNYNPISINDANSTYSNTAGQDEQAAFANGVSGNFAIAAVKIVARANAPAGSAISGLKLGFNNGGTVGVGSAHTVTSAFQAYSDILIIDPTTGQPFTSIDGYQLDLRSA